jgi:hypothetical protein
MNYREQERQRAIDLLKNTDLFDHADSGRKIKYMGKEYPKDEILLDGINNIYIPIQSKVLDYFRENKIVFWHAPRAKEPADKPSGHVLSSQVCCINHLFPLRQDKETVLKLAKAVCPDFVEVLRVTTDEYAPEYIQFEAVSDKDHLNEIENEGRPTRGSLCTAVDALIYAIHKNGGKYILPIEWKYTENYSDEDKSIEDRGDPKGNELKGKERLKRYSDLIDKSKFLKSFSAYRNSVYFYEPFYQLMRQTLWAEQMINHKDTETIKADNYIHVHVIPKENKELLDKKYKVSNKFMVETWLNCLQDTNKYKIITPSDFIKDIDKNKYHDFIKYITNRYWKIN